MPEDDHVIRQEVVRISPDLTGFAQKLRIGVNKAVKGPPPITAKVRAVAEITGFRTDLRNKLKTVDVRYQVKVEADVKGLHRSIRDALRKARLSAADEKFEIKLDVNEKSVADANEKANRLHRRIRHKIDQETKAWDEAHNAYRYNRAFTWQQRMDQLREQALAEDLRRSKVAERERTRIADIGARERAARQKKFTDVIGRDRYGPKIIDLGGAGIRPMNALYGVVALMSPALFAMGASAVQASTAIAGLGAAGIGAAAGLVAITVGFSRVREALKLRDAATKADMRATTEKASQVRAIQSANRQVADSERSLADALVDAARARRGINDVYKEATRDLRDLREAVSDLALEESEASLGVDQAREKQAAVNRNFWATELEKREAAIDLQKALERQSDLRTEGGDKRRALAEAERRGIEGSDKVVAAREREADANRRVLDAQRALNEARADRGSTTGAAALPNAGNAAAQELAARRKEMSKSANEMLDFFIDNDALLKKLRSDIENATLPGFTKFLNDITKQGKDGTSTMDVLADTVKQAGGAISKTVGDLGETAKTPWFKGEMVKLNAQNAQSFDLLGKAANTLVKPLMRIVVAASPLFTRFSAGMLKFAEWLDRVIQKADESGKLADWFEKAGDALARWVNLGKEIGRFLLPVFQLSLPTGNNLVERLTAFIAQLADWSNSAQGRKEIADFFEKIRTLPYGDIAKFLFDLTTTIGAFKLVKLGIKHPFVALIGTLATIDPATTGALLDTLAKTALDVLGFINDHKEAAATLLGIFGAVKLGKSIVDIGVKLPEFTSLKSFITKLFTGGDSTTASMIINSTSTTVHGTVVNVWGPIGGAGVPVGVGPRVPVGPGGGVLPVPGGGGLPKTSNTIPGMKSLLAVVGIAIATMFWEEITGGIVDVIKNGGAGARLTAKAGGAIERWFSHTLPEWITPNEDKNDNGWTGFGESFAKDMGEMYAPIERWFSHTLPENLNKDSPVNGGGWDGFWNSFWGDNAIKSANEASKAFNVIFSGNQMMPKDQLFAPAGSGNQNFKALDQAGSRSLLVSKTGITPPSTQPPLFSSGQNLMQGLQDGFDAKSREFNQQYLPGWGRGVTDSVQQSLGEKSPSRITYVHGADLINGLWNGFVGRWTELLTTVTKWVNDNILNPFQTQFSTGAEGIKKAFTTPFETLTNNLAPHIKKALGWLDTNLLAPVNNVLRAIGVAPIGVALGAAAGAGARQIAAVVSRADGGPVPGFSPNSRADNIPAMLTAKEYVQPVDAVKHYGTDFMDAVRTKQFPMYADGGLVGAYGAANGTEGFVNQLVIGAIKSTGGNTVQDIANNVMGAMFGFMGGGKAVGDISVARIAEATARSMGASTKQLVALIEAGIVESGMRNIAYGDRDSVGFLQQRAGWGSLAQRMDVAHATASFIRSAKAKDKPGYSAGQLAQAVQVSAFPLRYDQREADAVAIINREAPGIPMVGGMAGLAGNWPSSPSAQRGDSGVWRTVVAMANASGLPHTFGNAYRPGDPKWHGSGRAVDFTGFNQDALATFFAARNPLELIHRSSRRDYAYTRGRNMGSFNPALMEAHRNHLHVAMAAGGLVPARKFDTGGVLPPGVTMAVNQTGRNEYVSRDNPSRRNEPVRLDRRDLMVLAQLVAQAVSSQQVHMDGRAVGEIIHAYDYLPRGL